MSDFCLARLRRRAVVFSFLLGTLGVIPRSASLADDGYVPVSAAQAERFERAGVNYELYELFRECSIEVTRPVDDDILDQILDLSGLRILTLKATLSPDQWTRLSRFDGTLSLKLKGELWSDRSLEQIASLPNVEELVLEKCAISGTGFVHLAHMEGLTELCITDCPIEDGNLHFLGRLAHLERLTLVSCPITGEGLSHPEVEYLFLSDSHINDKGVASIGQMKSLSMLKLDGTRITDAALAHLSQLENLEYLDLANTNIKGRGLLWLMMLPQLRHLDLSNSALRSAQLEQLAGHSSLEFVSLQGLAVTSHDLRVLSTLPRLTTLSLSNAPIGNDACEAIAAMPALETLYVDGTRLDDGCLVALSYAPKLTSVQCQRTKISKSGARWLAGELASNNGQFAFVDTDDVGSEGVINLSDRPERK